MFTDINKLNESIKSNINWSELLIIVTKVIMKVLDSSNDSSGISAEMTINFIQLLTSLIEKCHFQCDGKIIDIIQMSNLSDIISNSTEFTYNAIIDMFKALIFSFPNSPVIFETALGFIYNSFNVKISSNMLNLLLFLLKASYNDGNNEIRNKAVSMVPKLKELIANCTDDYSNAIVFLICEEMFLYEALDSSQIKLILGLAYEKILRAMKANRELLDRMIKASEDSSLKIDYRNDEAMNTEICEYKASILNIINTLMLREEFLDEETNDILKVSRS